MKELENPEKEINWEKWHTVFFEWTPDGISILEIDGEPYRPANEANDTCTN